MGYICEHPDWEMAHTCACHMAAFPDGHYWADKPGHTICDYNQQQPQWHTWALAASSEPGFWMLQTYLILFRISIPDCSSRTFLTKVRGMEIFSVLAWMRSWRMLAFFITLGQRSSAASTMDSSRACNATQSGKRIVSRRRLQVCCIKKRGWYIWHPALLREQGHNKAPRHDQWLHARCMGDLGPVDDDEFKVLTSHTWLRG